MGRKESLVLDLEDPTAWEEKRVRKRKQGTLVHIVAQIISQQPASVVINCRCPQNMCV